jgi:hypothetical protein
MLALDCTTSMGEYIVARRIAPEAAAAIAGSLFGSAAGLQVQLVYFRGDDQSSAKPRQLQASGWLASAPALARAIASVEHWPGWTQHCRLLRQAVDEAKKQRFQELVVLSDAFEEATPRRPQGDNLRAALLHAETLRDLGVSIAIGFKGTIRNACPLDRAGSGAERRFRDIASANGGSAFLFQLTGLHDRFAEIGARAALAAQGDAAGAARMLEHMQAVPFEMNTVGEQAFSAKCAAGNDQEGEQR